MLLKMYNENGHKQSLNTHVEENIFARQNSKAQIGFGLFRKKELAHNGNKKELAHNSTENCSLLKMHTSFY